ncbi:MAG: hypothetical protein HZA80_03060 [Candidatus Taylorbacteria bacterium]|nr:hypothetical protein [Candidatus Taylorbacteria bacterium]
MTKAVATTISKVHLYRERIFYTLCALLAVSAISYGYLLQKAIVNVVEREAMIKELRIATSRVADLESSYLALKNTVTLELAFDRGFKEANHLSYIKKGSLGQLTLSNEL